MEGKTRKRKFARHNSSKTYKLERRTGVITEIFGQIDPYGNSFTELKSKNHSSKKFKKSNNTKGGV